MAYLAVFAQQFPTSLKGFFAEFHPKSGSGPSLVPRWTPAAWERRSLRGRTVLLQHEPASSFPIPTTRCWGTAPHGSCRKQRQLELNVCGMAVVVIPIGYSYVMLYFYISKIPPVFSRALNAHGEQTAVAQTSIAAIRNENEHPARFQPLLGIKKGKRTPPHPRGQTSSATNFMWNWGKKRKSHIAPPAPPFITGDNNTPSLKESGGGISRIFFLGNEVSLCHIWR